MQSLLYRLINHIDRQAERRTDAGSRRRAQMGDMIDLVFVQADALDQIHLDFVARGNTLGERCAGEAAMLRHRQDRSNIVAGVRIICRQKGVVEIEFAHGHAIGPCRPFR